MSFIFGVAVGIIGRFLWDHYNDRLTDMVRTMWSKSGW